MQGLGHKSVLSDLEVEGSGPCQVNLGVCCTSVQVVLEPIIKECSSYYTSAITVRDATKIKLFSSIKKTEIFPM